MMGRILCLLLCARAGAVGAGARASAVDAAAPSAFLPVSSVPWLTELAASDVLAELQTAAATHAAAFAPDWQNLTAPGTSIPLRGGWPTNESIKR